jgi:hypothetical protein
MNAAAEAAIGRSNYALAAHALGEANDPLRDEVGVFDDVGGVAAPRPGDVALAFRMVALLRAGTKRCLTCSSG